MLCYAQNREDNITIIYFNADAKTKENSKHNVI